MSYQSLDFYCERLDPSFWAEPINAWSNLGFILVGIWAFSRHPKFDRVGILSILLTCIGLGSFAFHTFADTRTLLGDLIPIFIFTSVYLYHTARKYLNLSTLMASGILVVTITPMILIERTVPKTFLNGSGLYLPPLIMLFTFGFWLKKLSDKRWSKIYLMAAGCFLLSLTFRTLDHTVCDSFALGTHFLWHLGNAVTLGLLMKMALDFEAKN